MKKRNLLIAAGVVAAGVCIWLIARPSKGPKVLLETAPISHITIRNSVTATGTVEPVTQVEVGTQVSGIIDKLYADYNDQVKAGQLIAEMDKVTLQAELESAQAQLASSKTEYEYQTKNYARTKTLHEKQLVSDAEYDQAFYLYETARNAYEQSQAAMVKVKRNLGYATITSPIDGVVLTRKVEPGQTVAAAMTAPVLFTLAEDLRRMELQVDVDEADVGKVKEGQEARFHVDAWPGQNFPAKVTRVGWGSQTKDQVVSYLTILEVRNDELLLRPGMTATADITTARRADVLLVPNMALRFAPPATRGQPKRSLLASLTPRPPSAGPKVASEAAPKDGSQTLWLLEGGQPRALRVNVIGSNGQVSEVRPVEAGSPLAPGAEVIVEAVAAKP